MGYDCSISMEGVHAAERQLNNAARKIADAGLAPICPLPGKGETGEISDRLSVSGPGDIAGALIEAKQAKIMTQANLKAISMQDEIAQEALDLIG